MRFKNFVHCTVLVSFISNSYLYPLYYALAGAGILSASPRAFAFTDPSQTPLLDELNQKFNLNNPTRNHQANGDVIPESVKKTLENPQTARDLTGEINSTLASPVTPNTIDLSKYNNPTNPPSFQQHRDLAVNLSKTQGMPSGAVSGDSIQSVDLQYKRKGTRKFVRDEQGRLVLQVTNGGDTVSGASRTDLLSSEATPGHPGYQFETNKESMYGDGQTIFTEVKSTHETFKDQSSGKSASARGYRAVTQSAYKAAMTPPPLSLLQPSFDHMQTTQDPNQWLSSCTTQTVPKNSQIISKSSTEHFCQDTHQSNNDFCEVSRVIKIPAYSNSPGLRSCGIGCFEFDMDVNAWKSSSCRSTPGDAAPAEFTLNLNLSAGLKIKTVTITGTADDHFKYTLNGQKIWESNGGYSQGFNGDWQVSGCNPDGYHTINADVTSRVQQIVGTLPDNGTFAMAFRGDVRWKQNGGMDSVIKVQLEDTSGEGLESKLIQYPEGCYDALTIEDKTLKGLNTSYTPTTGGSGDSSKQYDCTRPPATKTCPIGDQLFGNPTQEKCIKTPTEEKVCAVGSFDQASNMCVSPANAPQPPQTSYTCSAGTLVGESCHTAPQINYSCPSSYTFEMVMKDGAQVPSCTIAPIGESQYPWACGSGNTFLPGSCTVYPEDYKDPFGNLYKTLDGSGYPITPVDNEGEPVYFEDIAKCSVTTSTTTPPGPTTPGSFCTFDSYENIEVGSAGLPTDVLNQIPPFYAGDDGNKTWKVNLNNYRCDPTNGRIMCYPDPETGQEKCYSWEDLRNLPDRCATYKNDERCQEISRDCTEGWLEPVTGRCMAETVTYRCTDEATINYETTTEVNSCESMIPCAGGNCAVSEGEQNDKFVQAMVAGSVIDNIQGDSKCADPSDPSTCEIFGGEYKYCSWETTGLGSNCCEEAKGVDILGYIVFTRQMLKVAQMVDYGAFGDGVAGGFKTLTEPITDAYDAISNWASEGIRSASESIFGNTASTTANGTISAMSEGVSVALEKLQQEVYSFIYDMLPDALRDMIFDVATEQATGEITNIALDNAITDTLSSLWSAYSTYQMIKLALTLLTACDEHEMDMGVKLAQRQCFKVGPKYCNKSYGGFSGAIACMQRRQDYCCYSSILARIIVKEAYSQLNINPLPYGNKLTAGTNEALGSCQGLTSEQLSQLDFNAPSMQTAMQEWIGLLVQSGSIPTETTEQSLTGGASAVDSNCPPQLKPKLFCYENPETGDEICEQSRDANGEIIYEQVPTECVKKLTPGQIWNAEDRKPATERITGDGGYIDGAQDRVLEGKDKVKDLLDDIDCSIYPRPPACDMQIDPTENH